MIDFPRTPAASLSDLWNACIPLAESAQEELKVIYAVTVGTASTPVQHGLGYIPKLAIPIPQADARVWRSANPDTRFVYFAASTSVVCDFLVLP